MAKDNGGMDVEFSLLFNKIYRETIIRNKNLGDITKLVMDELICSINADCLVMQTQKEIAGHLGKSLRCIADCIKELKANRFIFQMKRGVLLVDPTLIMKRGIKDREQMIKRYKGIMMLTERQLQQFKKDIVKDVRKVLREEIDATLNKYGIEKKEEKKKPALKLVKN